MLGVENNFFIITGQTMFTELVIFIILYLEPLVISLLNASVHGDLIITGPLVKLSVVNVQVFQFFCWKSNARIFQQLQTFCFELVPVHYPGQHMPSKHQR